MNDKAIIKKAEYNKTILQRNDAFKQKNKEKNYFSSCNVCDRLRDPKISPETALLVISAAKIMGKESCAISFMQRNYGNGFTSRVLTQPSTVISQPTIQKKCASGSSYTRCEGEEEAERMSMSIMKMTKPPPITYKPSAYNNEQSQISEIMSNKGSGQSLDENTRSFMEERFDYDFSPVRVHTDSYAAKKSNELNAEAFTIGRDIFFNAGRYNPSSTEGKKLLAHELTHVVQCNGENITIKRWGSEVHKRITEEVGYALNFDGFFIFHIASSTPLMDYRVAALSYNARVLLGGEAKPLDEALNHGEGGQYRLEDKTLAASLNETRQNSYLNEAIKFDKKFKEAEKQNVPVHKLGSIAEHMFEQLGFALHVAQDRGSHGEGVKGEGHDQKNYDCDDPSKNSLGYDIAKKNTIKVLMKFKEARGY